MNASDPSPPASSSPKRFQFTLRRLFIVTTLIALPFGFYMSPIEQEGRAVAAIRKAGGIVEYEGRDYGYSFSGEERPILERYRSRSCKLNVSEENGLPNHDPDRCLRLARNVLSLEAVDYSLRFKSKEPLNLLNDLPNIKTLRFWGVPVLDEHLLAIRELKNLRTLEAGHAELTSAAFENFAERFPLLEKVAVQLECDPTNAFIELARCRTLKDVSVSSKVISKEDISRLSSLPDLRKLSVHSPTISDDDLEGVLTCRELESLGISFDCNGFTSNALDRLQQLTKLRELTIGCPYERGALGDVSSALSIPTLVSLKLTNTHLTNSDFEKISQIPRLEHLRLLRSKCDPAGLALLSRMKSLQEIEFYDCGITDDHLKAMEVFPATYSFSIQDHKGPPRVTLQLIKETLARTSSPPERIHIIDAGRCIYFYQGRDNYSSSNW